MGTTGSAAVACKQMGFQGSANLELASCASVGGGSCGLAPPHMSDLSCGGNEQSVLECASERGDDVFCAAQEAIVLGCVGAGDAQGRAKKGSTSPSKCIRL